MTSRKLPLFHMLPEPEFVGRLVTGEKYCAKGCDQYRPVHEQNRKALKGKNDG